MTKLTGVELKRAQLVPSSMFAGPEQVLSSSRLSTSDKIAILRRWEFDERGHGSTADPAARLTRIRQALRRLEATSADVRAAPRTRH